MQRRRRRIRNNCVIKGVCRVLNLYKRMRKSNCLEGEDVSKTREVEREKKQKQECKKEKDERKINKTNDVEG